MKTYFLKTQKSAKEGLHVTVYRTAMHSIFQKNQRRTWDASTLGLLTALKLKPAQFSSTSDTAL